jgi:hypothetical protein
MPYDPQWPQNGQNIDADRFRGQFGGIIDLINAAPGLTGVVVDNVTTGNPGDPASVNLSLVGTELHFSFTIPRGNDGGTGPQGEPGPPFASATVDGVTTLDPGNAATVDVTYDGSNVHFTFGLPRGADGASSLPVTDFVVDSTTTLPAGSAATADAAFDGGAVHLNFGIPQGDPGEVSNADLTTAIAGTSSNTNAVGTIPNAAAVDYDQGTMQALLDKTNELILALRR